MPVSFILFLLVPDLFLGKITGDNLDKEILCFEFLLYEICERKHWEVMHHFDYRDQYTWEASTWLVNPKANRFRVCTWSPLHAWTLWPKNNTPRCEGSKHTLGWGLWSRCWRFWSCKTFGSLRLPCHHCCPGHSGSHCPWVPLHWSVFWENWCVWLWCAVAGAHHWTTSLWVWSPLTPQ